MGRGRGEKIGTFEKKHGLPPEAMKSKEYKVENKVPKEFVIKVLVEPDGNNFHSYCPALKGLHSCGNTREEALCNALDAVAAYMSSVIKHGEPIPEGIKKV